jgi:hypothetical protein
MKNFFHMVTCAKAKLMDGKLQRVSDAIVSHERVESVLSPLLAALFLVLPSTTARRWIKIPFSCAHAVEVDGELVS